MHLALSGPHCSAGSGATADDGTMPFDYNNDLPNTLQTGSNFSGGLHVYQVTGCRQMLHSGRGAAVHGLRPESRADRDQSLTRMNWLIADIRSQRFPRDRRL